MVTSWVMLVALWGMPPGSSCWRRVGAGQETLGGGGEIGKFMQLNKTPKNNSKERWRKETRKGEKGQPPNLKNKTKNPWNSKHTWERHRCQNGWLGKDGRARGGEVKIENSRHKKSPKSARLMRMVCVLLNPRKQKKNYNKKHKNKTNLELMRMGHDCVGIRGDAGADADVIDTARDMDWACGVILSIAFED